MPPGGVLERQMGLGDMESRTWTACGGALRLQAGLVDECGFCFYLLLFAISQVRLSLDFQPLAVLCYTSLLGLMSWMLNGWGI